MILRQKTVEWEAENNKNKTKSNLFFQPLNSVKTEERSPREQWKRSDYKEGPVRDSRLSGGISGGEEGTLLL